jgi:hypothetical protein
VVLAHTLAADALAGVLGVVGLVAKPRAVQILGAAVPRIYFMRRTADEMNRNVGKSQPLLRLFS